MEPTVAKCDVGDLSVDMEIKKGQTGYKAKMYPFFFLIKVVLISAFSI